MIKLFFALIFLAELIVAFAVIINIYRLDRCVVEFNQKLLYKRSYIKSSFIDFRLAVAALTKGIIELKTIIAKKREEYILKVTKTLLSYSLIFMLRGKYKKTFIAYQVAKEIYEGCLEA